MTPKILICQCEQARVLPQETLEAVKKGLAAAGASFETLPDLCELAARRDPRLAQWAASPVKIAACYPRAVQWLLAAAGVSLKSAELVNLRDGPASEATAALLSPEISANTSPSVAPGPIPTESAAPAPGWPAWFPVIDYDRCTQCMQCLGFCLFGVYGVDANQNIEVTNPSQCKINCPACSRVCPQGAILFPKHKTGAINGRDLPGSGQPPAKLDISMLLGGDAQSLLRDRSARARNRFSKERTDDQALSERRKLLAQQGMITDDIPPEVLTNLPSAEVITKKIEEAAARAKAALEARKQS